MLHYWLWEFGFVITELRKRAHIYRSCGLELSLSTVGEDILPLGGGYIEVTQCSGI